MGYDPNDDGAGNGATDSGLFVKAQPLRWNDDIPPHFAQLDGLGQRCLDEANAVGRVHPGRSRLEHNLLDFLRSQALATGYLADQTTSPSPGI